MRLDYGPFPTLFIGDHSAAVKAFNSDAVNDRPYAHMAGYRMLRGEESSGLIPGVGFTSGGKQW